VPVQAGHRFPDKTVTLDPWRVGLYVDALGVDPEEGWSAEPGSPLPPGFLMYVTMYGAEIVHDSFAIDFRKAVYGGMDAEFFAPIRVGDTVTVAPFVSNHFTKSGSRGDLTFVELTTEYRLPDGTLAARERSTTIQRG
jgi:hypothetical protein